MNQIIVTVKRLGEDQTHDIELATDIQASDLSATLAVGLGWDTDPQGQPITYLFEAHPPGRFVRPQETLAQAQVWDGAWLILHPDQSVTAPMVPEPPTDTNPNLGSGYSWKQVA